MRAPVSVDGAWRLQADSDQLSALPCGKSLASSQGAVLTISQSGHNLVLALNNGTKTTAPGVLGQNTLTALVVPSAAWAQDAGCGSGQALAFRATVDPKAYPRTLSGTLSADGCKSCAPVEFHAVRELSDGNQGKH